jgi:hypothetical protein
MSKRYSGTELVQATGLTLGERIDAIRLATHEAHANRIAEVRQAFETRIVDLIQSRIDLVIDGVLAI